MAIKNLDKLSEIQKRLLFYILCYIDTFGYPPTRGEMAEYFSIARKQTFSRQWAEYHLQAMEKLGVLRIKKDKTRRDIEVLVEKEDKAILERETVGTNKTTQNT